MLSLLPNNGFFGFVTENQDDPPLKRQKTDKVFSEEKTQIASVTSLEMSSPSPH